MRYPARKLAIVAASVALGGFVFLLFDFLVVSSLIEDWESGDRAGYVRYEDGWYTLAPSVRVASAWGRAVYPWRTDANGFRIDHHRTSASGPADVVFLGDSFTFGTGLPWDDTFVGLYEKNSSRAVINAGVGSYSPTAYLWQYKYAISTGTLRPRHTVIVAVDISDVQDEAAVWESGKDHPRKRGRPTSTAVISPTASFRSFVAERFLGTRSIYRFLRRQIMPNPPINEPSVDNDYTFDQVRSAFTWKDWSAIEPARPGAAGYNLYGYEPLGVMGGLETIRARLSTISSIARENNSELWILIYPWPAQLLHPSKQIDWEKFNADMCREIQCRGVINTFPRFRAFTRNRDWYQQLFVPGDVHFNKYGNQVIAEEIAATVK